MGQIVKIGLTRDEAQALEARLVRAGLKVLVGRYEDFEPER